MDEAATEEAPRPRRGLLAVALTVGALGVIGFGALGVIGFAGAGVSAGQSSSSGPSGADGTAVPVQQSGGERRDGDCPFKERGQQSGPGEAAPDGESPSNPAPSPAPDDRSVSL